MPVFTLYAQEEHWDTYITITADKPVSFLVDMGLQSVAPVKQFPYLVITGPHAQDCNAQKMPVNEEIPKLEEILDATGIFLTGITAKMLAGTVTYDCQRVNYYYVKDTIGIRNAIARLYERSYKDYSYTLKIRQDPEWLTYRTYLYPDEKMQLWMENNKKIAEMREKGDSLTKERNINFTFYFPSEIARDSFALFAGDEHLTTKLLPSTINGSLYGIIVTKYGPVKMSIINTLSATLITEAKKYKGSYYNGWSADLK